MKLNLEILQLGLHCLQMSPYFKDLVLNKDPFGILGPYFHYFGFIHAEKVNFLIFAGIGSGLHCGQILIFTYACALIFIHRHFGSILRPLEGLEGLEGFRGLRRLEGLGGV